MQRERVSLMRCSAEDLVPVGRGGAQAISGTAHHPPAGAGVCHGLSRHAAFRGAISCN